MGITGKDLEHIASLAKLRLEKVEADEMLKDLESVLQYMRTLDSLDVAGAEPLSSGQGTVLGRGPDAAGDGLSRAEVLSEAPDSLDGHFRVPRVSVYRPVREAERGGDFGAHGNIEES